MNDEDKTPDVEIRCPLNFTVRLKPQNAQPHECGHACCHPETCSRLQMAAEQLKNEGRQ